MNYRVSTCFDRVKGKSAFTSDIGVKSDGFAPIFTLALIIALGVAFIAFIMWRVQ